MEFVYVFRQGKTNRYKIGRTKDLAKRRKQVQTGNSDEITLVCAIQCDGQSSKGGAGCRVLPVLRHGAGPRGEAGALSALWRGDGIGRGTVSDEARHDLVARAARLAADIRREYGPQAPEGGDDG